jgi:beta-lactamase regulating signal transducer with metallopeptidase domain
VNTISPMLLGSIAHATVFAIMGTLVYLALRRYSPAAGALASSSSLVIMAVVSLVVLGPWPRWSVLAPGESIQEATAASANVEQTHPALAAQEQAKTSTRSIDGAPIERGASGIRKVPVNPDTSLGRFFGEIVRELRRPGSAAARSHWGWPEWIALGVFASFCVGLARLGLGVLTIQSLRSRSKLIADVDLNDQIQILCAELSCTSPVEARETALLSTPATIGWRQPILLLPGDWRHWSHAERHAVLAHELAHVSRGDFLAGFAAQLCLALHFYHPLAHWLAARLRLEQELAADAWGAALSGGKTTYLASLAQMALRRDTKALTWPARAFLPSRGTFVRRIEMLRNTTRISHASLPISARLLTVGILAAIGILVAGLRGPAGQSTARAQSSTQEAAAGNTTAQSNETFNLAFLPAEAKLVVAVRPRTLLQRREARALLDSLKRSPAFQRILIVPPEDVEQLLAFWEGIPSGAAQPGGGPLVPFPSGCVLRMSKPQEWKPLLNQLLRSPREVQLDGQTYLRPDGPERWGVFTPDDRTLVVAQEDLLRELIEDRKAPAPRHPWDEAWSKVVKGQAMVALEARWVRRRIAQGLQGGPAGPGGAPGPDLKLETISPLLEKAQSYALGIDASDGMTVDLVAATASEDATKPVASTLQALVTLSKNGVQGLRRDLHGQAAVSSEALEWVIAAADSLLDKARLETTGNFVHLQAKASLDLAEGMKLLGPAVSAANVANNRVISTNNLKQIVLAFHNYHSARNCFPTSVLYGGASGKVPHSWRVAILPYIEQQELYNHYNFDEPWDSPNNRKLLDQMPAIYSFPAPSGGPSSRTNASYFVFTGQGAALDPVAARERKTAKSPTIMDITDGTSNTILVVEARRDIPWTKPEDIPLAPNGVLPDLGGFTPDGFNAAFADGAVFYLKKSIHPAVLKALITRDGGEVVSRDFDGPTPTPTRPPVP